MFKIVFEQSSVVEIICEHNIFLYVLLKESIRIPLINKHFL